MQLFLAEGVAERTQIRELANRAGIELVNTCESLLANGFLIIGKEETSKLSTLEEVLAMVVRLGHGEHILMHIRLILFVVIEFKTEARSRWHTDGLLSIEGLCRVKRLIMTLYAVAKVARFSLFMPRLIVHMLGALDS